MGGLLGGRGGGGGGEGGGGEGGGQRVCWPPSQTIWGGGRLPPPPPLLTPVLHAHIISLVNWVWRLISNNIIWQQGCGFKSQRAHDVEMTPY